MSKDKDCFNCLHYSACLWNGEYTPTPCRLYEDKTEWSKQSEGEWGFDGMSWTCSECGEYATKGIKTNFCPNCGAKMKGSVE